MAPSATKCGKCNKKITNYQYLHCIKCNLHYDLDCANVSWGRFNAMDSDRKKNWRCYAGHCASKPMQTNSSCTLTPLTKQSPDSPEVFNVTIRSKKILSSLPDSPKDNTIPTDEKELQLTESRLREIIKHELTAIIKCSITEELRNIYTQISEFKDSMIFYNQQYEDLKKCVDEKCHIIDHLQSENTVLQSTVNDLSNRLTLVEQHMRENNVEINGIPEFKSENLESTIKQLSETVKNPLLEGDIL